MFAKAYIYSIKHYYNMLYTVRDTDGGGMLHLSNLYYMVVRLNIHDKSFNIIVIFLFRFSRLSQSLTMIIIMIMPYSREHILLLLL